MMYVVALSGTAGLLVLWCVARMLRDRRVAALKQVRLSSAFDRSHAVESHGHGAIALSQNILIAELTAHASRHRR